MRDFFSSLRSSRDVLMKKANLKIQATRRIACTVPGTPPNIPHGIYRERENRASRTIPCFVGNLSFRAVFFVLSTTERSTLHSVQDYCFTISLNVTSAFFVGRCGSIVPTRPTLWPM
jgi:hypothetical protein